MSRLGFGQVADDTIEVGGRRFTLRRSRRRDLPALAALLRDDVLGSGREQPAEGSLAGYEKAFDLIDSDPRQLLVTIEESSSAAIVGTLQLSLLAGLSRSGATRLQIEAVRIAPDQQGAGLGRAVFAWAHERGRAAGATLSQLTTDKSRTDAHRFYERLGYIASHEGLKLEL